MDENNGYGVKLKLDVSEFKSNLKQASDLASKTGKKIQEDLNISKKLPTTAFKFSFPEQEHYSFKQYNSILDLQKSNKLQSLKVDFDGISKSMSIFKQNSYDGSLAIDSIDNKVKQLKSDMDAIQTKNFTHKFFEMMGNGNSLKAYRENFKSSTFDIKNFEKSLKESSNTTEKEIKRIKLSSDIVKNAFKEQMNIRVDSKSSNAQIRKLQSEIYDIERSLNQDLELPVKYRMSTKERIELEADLEKVKNKLYELQNVSKDTGNKMGNSLNKGIEKGYKSIKKLTIGFLGARTAFSLFRSQLSNYRAENEQFNASMTLTTDIITQTLAPAFEWFGNVLQYTFIGLARIIELMFNVNILSKVTANGLKRASDSAKELNDNLTGLDEITNLSNDNGSTLSGITAQLNALDEFQKKINEVNKWLKDSGLDKFFPRLGKGIKDVWSWVKQHPWETVLGVGTFFTLKSLLPSILGVSGGTIGLFGIATALGIIAGISIYNAIKEWKEYNEAIKNYEHNLETVNKKSNEIITNQIERIDKLEYSAEEAEIAFSNSAGVLISSIEDIEKTDERASKSILLNLNRHLKLLESLREQGYLTSETEKAYAKILEETKISLKEAGLKGKEYETTIKNIDTALNNLDGKKSQALIELDMDTSKAQSKQKGFFANLWDSISGTWKALMGQADPYSKKADGGIFIGSTWKDITAYAGGGLPSVGQMFVAREAGPELVGTIGGNTAVMNNNQIVSSVSAGVAQAVASVLGNNSNDRPIIFNINGKEFARATFSDYQAEARRVGINTSIRRY